MTKYDLSNILKNKLDKTNRTREELTKGKSVLMIANRLSTIQDADQILVFKDGKIIERGTHNELLEKKGTYASMWKNYQTSVSWKVGEGDEKHD